MFTVIPSQYYFRRGPTQSPIRKPRVLEMGKPSVMARGKAKREELNLEAVRSALAKMAIGPKPVGTEPNRQVFKGSALVSALLYTSPRQFKCRAIAYKFAKRLFRLGFIRSIFGWTSFEDSSHLYRWDDENVPPRSSSRSAMMSYPNHSHGVVNRQKVSEPLDRKLIEDVRGSLVTRGDKSGGYLIDSFFRDLEKNFPQDCKKSSQKHSPSYWTNKRASAASTDSSADPYTLYNSRDRLAPKSGQSASMASSREHSAIPEESTDTYMIGRLGMQMAPFDLEIANTPGTYNSHASSGGESAFGMDQSNRRYADQNFSFSDNEKQLMEEMKRMKKEHQHILRSYEDRINKLMMKMHELRSIAEMLENSSTKSSPYGVMPGKGGLLGSIEGKFDQDQSYTGSNPNDSDVPPPLPPRPSRGNKVYPNKPIFLPRRKMKYIPWNRIILSDLGTPGTQLSIWHTMVEPKVDAEAVEEQFNDEVDPERSPISLYDDVFSRRGRSRSQVSVIDREKGQQLLNKIQFLKMTLQDLLQAISDLQTTFLDNEGSETILDLVLSHKDMDRVLHQVKKKGQGQLDIPDFILYEVSRLDHYRTKAELLRFQQRIHDYIFDIDQQLKDVRTACEEICSSVYLKNLLETLLAVGNHMNGGTATGQADGFQLEILTALKSTEEKEGKGNLLSFLIKLYCKMYTEDISRYSLPEPSSMRHASQVSLSDVNKALEGLSDDLNHVRKNITPLLGSNNGPLSQLISERLQQFFVKAEEAIEAQRKHYRETKENFQRTAAYFMFDGDNGELCTKKFFGTWATFLHECKHYWPEVQRQLAKNRFQNDFAIVPDKVVPSFKLPLQDPPPDIPPKPYHSPAISNHQKPSPTKSKTERPPPEPRGRNRDVWETPDSVAISNPARGRDTHHSRGTIERPPRATQDVKSPPSRKSTQEKDVASNRSSSPKRFVSTPPTTGDIHRPVPTPPKSSPHFNSNPHTTRSGNYENQDAVQSHSTTPTKKDHSPPRQGYNAPPSPRRAQIPVPDVEESQRKQPNGFSLKSWLRKEGTKGRPSNPEQIVPSKEQENQKQNTPFVKLRNTVVQKFANSNSRKPNDSSPESKHRSPQTESRDARHGQHSKYAQGHRDTSSGRSRSRSPSGERHKNKPRPDSDVEAEEEVAFYNGRLSKGRDSSPNKQHENKLPAPVIPPKPELPISNQNVQSFGAIDTYTGSYRTNDRPKPENDLNNNEPGSPRTANSQRVRGRDRAPLALGSNISLSDPYPRSEQINKTSQRATWDVNQYPHHPTENKHRHYNTIAGTSPTNPSQTYRATMVHMYENQSKFDAVDNMQQDYSQDSHFPKPSQKYNTLGQGRSNNYLLMQSKDGYTGRSGQMPYDPNEISHRPQRRQRTEYIRNSPEKSHTTPNQGSVPSQLNPRDKSAAHAQSITSLIERFDSGKGPPPPGNQDTAMTSTPVQQRKNGHLSLHNDSNRYPQHNQVQNPFPLLDAINQAASGNPTHTEPQRSSVAGGELGSHGRYHGEPMTRPGHHSYPPQPGSHQSHGYEHQQRRPDQDEGYRDQLRRALNNTNSVKHRYPKTNPAYSGQSSSYHRSPPQMMRAMPGTHPSYNRGGVTV